MEITPKNFDTYTKDTVENRIIRAMMRGDKAMTFDNNDNNIGKCRDEVLTEDEIAAHLRHNGFQVGRLLTTQDGVEEHAGYVVKWGSDDN